jgi:ornithine cyclodeaminase
MLYLNEHDLRAIGVDWESAIEVIRRAVACLSADDFAQPIKPYLRYRDERNRLIAMPAFVGGAFNAAGLKWIASFPGNVDRGLPRAHSVVVLNDAETGAPTAIINTALLSVIRTVAVSGLMMKAFDAARPLRDFKLGVTGFGPIGRHHVEMAFAVFGDRLREVCVYDVRAPALAAGEARAGRVRVAERWEQAYADADVFITCTVSPRRYIDRPPRPGSLQLNVSLRDYDLAVFDHVRHGIVVDDWDEVCREATDIELFHRARGLDRDGVKTLADVVLGDAMRAYPAPQPIMFNPRGMGEFDIAMAAHYTS